MVTDKVPKKFHEISYTLDDDEEEGESEGSEETNNNEEEKNDKKSHSRVDKLMQNGNNIIRNSRLRQKNTNDN